MKEIERLVLEGTDPRGFGHQHGEALRAEIQAVYAIRLELLLAKTDLGDEDTALRLCEQHLPLLAKFDARLYEELCGIAEGSGRSAAQIVLVNHYTDLRDLRKEHVQGGEQCAGDATAAARGEATFDADGDQGCSVVFCPTDEGPWLGQTWDMHGSATDYVRLLEVPGGPEGGPAEGRTQLFTLAGCVGMTGLTSWGLGMTINNLNSTDATCGVVWPCVVRKALRMRDARAARDVVLGAPLGSGHHYLVADARDLFGVETSGTRKKMTQSGVDRRHLHTNHCLDPEMATTCRILPTSTTLARYERLRARMEQGAAEDAPSLWEALASVSNGQIPGEPHGVATCGAFAMNLQTRLAWACQGPPSASPLPQPTSPVAGNAPAAPSPAPERP